MALPRRCASRRPSQRRWLQKMPNAARSRKRVVLWAACAEALAQCECVLCMITCSAKKKRRRVAKAKAQEADVVTAGVAEDDGDERADAVPAAAEEAPATRIRSTRVSKRSGVYFKCVHV
jgi:hypothetical protein